MPRLHSYVAVGRCCSNEMMDEESLIETSHPVIGAMRFARPPVRFIGQDYEKETFPERHAPFLGDHTREILSELHFDESVIERLEQREANNRALMSAAIAEAQQSANS